MSVKPPAYIEQSDIATKPSQMYVWDGTKPVRIPGDADGNISTISIGSLVPKNYDYMAFTYVVAGNGAGKAETITYKIGGAGGTTSAVLTFTYNANNKIATITRT